MPSCSVKFCRNWNGNTTSRGIKFFRFPADSGIADIWIKACENEKLNLKNARICSIHFSEDCFERKPEHLIVPGDTNIIRLSKTAIPTLNLHIKDGSTRCSGRKRKQLQVLQECQQNNEPPLKKSTINVECINNPLADSVNDKENVGCGVQDNIEQVYDTFGSVALEGQELKEQSSTELDTHEQTHNCEVTRLQEENLSLQAGNNGLKIVCDFLKTENNDLKMQNDEFKNKNEELQNKCSTLELENKIMKKDLLKLNKKLCLQQKAEQ